MRGGDGEGAGDRERDREARGGGERRLDEEDEGYGEGALATERLLKESEREEDREGDVEYGDDLLGSWDLEEEDLDLEGEV